MNNFLMGVFFSAFKSTSLKFHVSGKRSLRKNNKWNHTLPCLALLILLALLASCSTTDDGDNSPTKGGLSSSSESYNTDPIEGLVIDEVYFAQTHVHTTQDTFFLLTGNRDVLLKVHVLAPENPASPKVEAEISVGGSSQTITLSGPDKLPATFEKEFGKVVHTFEDCFTGIIPKEMVRPGLEVTINTQDSQVTKQARVSAPNPMILKMFDVHFFTHSSQNYVLEPEFFAEWEAKLPVSSVNITRVSDIVFDELVVPAREDVGTPHVKVSSKEEYLEKTGRSFNGEVAAGRKMLTALTGANGLYNLGLHWLNIIGVASDGSGGNFAGVNGFGGKGIFHHEVGHAFGLGHVGNSATYPYRGDMYGIKAPQQEVHVGPVWAYDPNSQTFIPPVNQQVLVETGEKVYKWDPMQGGGSGAQEEEFQLNHFSDRNVHRMHNIIMKKLAVEKNGQYYRWDTLSNDYSLLQRGTGVDYPLEEDVEVYTLMAGCFLGEGYQDISIVYPAVGPYNGNLLYRFDPRSAADRADAIAKGFVPNEGSDFSLRVLQGGDTSYYMLRASGSFDDDPYTYHDYKGVGVNVPASGGRIEEIVLLHTPDAEINGLPENPEVLDRWINPRQPVTFDEAPVDVFEDFERNRGDDYDLTEWTEKSLWDVVQKDHIYSEVNGRLMFNYDTIAGELKHITINNTAIHNDNAVISVETGVSDGAGERYIYFFYHDEYNHYMLNLNNSKESILFSVVDGKYTVLNAVDKGAYTGAFTPVEITLTPDGKIDITFAGDPLISAQVEGGFEFSGGRVGLGGSQRRTNWDNLSVTSTVD